MRWLRFVSLGVASMFMLPLGRVLSAQAISPQHVEQQIRASLAAWNAGDPVQIVQTPGLSNDMGIGFGYRTRAPRTEVSKEDQLEVIRRFLASVEYLRVTMDEIHAAVDGDIGLAWGFFTEEFQVRGSAPEKISVRFTTVLRREGGGWRQLLFHRDAQRFDDTGNFIPTASSSDKLPFIRRSPGVAGKHFDMHRITTT